MIKILLGGSPCTFWSIAQKAGRETEAEGTGWELFKNYLIAKDKFDPDLFLYENNKSAAQPIKDQISRTLDVDLMYINSALVSAQNRQRSDPASINEFMARRVTMEKCTCGGALKQTRSGSFRAKCATCGKVWQLGGKKR